MFLSIWSTNGPMGYGVGILIPKESKREIMVSSMASANLHNQLKIRWRKP